MEDMNRTPSMAGFLRPETCGPDTRHLPPSPST